MASNDPPDSEVAAAAPAPAAADDEEYSISLGMSTAAPAPAPAPAADGDDDWASASFGMSTAAPANDPPSPTVTAVEHTEGTSYMVAFGDPERYPLLFEEKYSTRPYPAAGGENPYRPETGLLPAANAMLVEVVGEAKPPFDLIRQIGNALCVPI